MNKIQLFAAAIQHFEGFYPGSRSFRNNNPANFRFTPFIKSLGAIKGDINNYAVFKTYVAGYAALITFLTDACQDKLKSYHSTMTLNDFYAVYAPAADKNSPLIYSKFVAGQLGVDPSVTQIKTFLN